MACWLLSPGDSEKHQRSPFSTFLCQEKERIFSLLSTSEPLYIPQDPAPNDSSSGKPS